MKEPIKIHVEFSLFYSKPKEEQLSDFKTVLNIVDILSMAKVLDNRKLCQLNVLKFPDNHAHVT